MSSRLAALVIVSLLALSTASPVRAQTDEPRAAPREAFLRTELAAGYWQYFQSQFADREADGFAMGLNGAFAWALADEVALGTAFELQFYDGGGHTSSGSSFGPDATVGGLWGFFLAWMPAGSEPPVSIELSAGFAGAGVSGRWGGFGPYVSPSVTVYFAHAGRSHFGITARLQYEPMFSEDATPHGAQKNFVFGSLAIGWTFF